ncbi:MAG: DUF4178 domain-containing protein [Pedosphaera sp.]|nr:DUF4178 domain-containing protein [Pedosphaera sp.]
MNNTNPTPIRIGMRGAFSGRSYRVAGRVVLSLEEAGATFYWNEFNLVCDDGTDATLVYEVTERGGEWRMFTSFEAGQGMTVAEAAARRVGDRVQLDGLDARVTLVGESRVHHIEGEAPEGVELGDVAHYFNAESGGRTLAVSWTGDEVEYYRGINLTRGMVMSAFKLPIGTMNELASGSVQKTTSISPPQIAAIIAVLAVFGMVFAGNSSCRNSRRAAAPIKIGAPPSTLTPGREGKLDGRNWQIAGHAVVEIGLVGGSFDRHEYPLSDDLKNRALLVQGQQPGDKNWYLFKPLSNEPPLAPVAAAALRVGQLINFDGQEARIAELFQSTILKADNSEIADGKEGAVLYGFNARAKDILFLVRWNDRELFIHRGQALAAKDVTAAFEPRKRN